jgi:hypothetical protein
MAEPQTEQEWADFYQAHKHDTEIWGEPEPAPVAHSPGRPGSKRGALITIRLTPDEAAIIRREAEETEATYSDVIRNAIRLLAEQRAH